MAVVRTRYVKKLEEEMARGKSFAEAHKIASKRATVKSTKRKPKYKKSLVKKVTRKLREVFYGKKTYAKKKFPPSRKRRT